MFAFLIAASLSQTELTELERLVSTGDDPLDTAVTFNTADLVPEKRTSDTEYSSIYLSAIKAKKTQTASYFLNVTISYTDTRYRLYSHINYAGADGPVAAKVTRSDARVVKCFSALDECLFREAFFIELPAKTFSDLAATSENLTHWPFKYTDRNGGERRYHIVPAEAAILQNVVKKHIDIK